MRKTWIIPVGIFLLIASALLLVQFRLMRSTTLSDSAIASGGISSSIGNPSNTALWVSGDRLAGRVRALIKGMAQNQPRFGEVSMLNAIADKFDLPVLAVDIQKQQYIWTPFYARSVYRLTVSYASNGDISFRSQPTPRFNMGDYYQLQGRYTLDDTSWGLISSPGYQDYMSERIADQVMKSLQEKFK